MSPTSSLALAGGVPVVPAGSHRPWPPIDMADERAVLAVLRRGVLCGTTAPEVTGLQKEWAWYCGTRYCLPTNSGTSALHCALAGVGVDAGDEVIVPAISFIATAYAVAHQGADPVFCDVDERTYNMDTKQVEALITRRTRAIMPVHLHGLPADMDEIAAIARRHGLAVVEDAAQAHGAIYKGRKVGTLGHGAGFSLNATKNLAGGEGGLYVTDDEQSYRTARRLAFCGEDGDQPGTPAPAYLSHGLGWNYRCSELTAALARSQLRRLDANLQRARANAAVLSEGLGSIPGVIPPPMLDDRVCTWHKYRVRLDFLALGRDGDPTTMRDRLVRALRAEGVAAVLWQTHPLPANPSFRRTALRPWSRRHGDQALRSWDPSSYPTASHVLDTSLLLGSERAPLCAQTPELMQRYVQAFAKVMGNLGTLLRLS